MREAQERIWFWWDDEFDVGFVNTNGNKGDTPDDAQEYVRADIFEELEAKLAKAVDVDLIEQAVSDVLSEGGSYRDAAEYVARTTLAELKGDKT